MLKRNPQMLVLRNLWKLEGTLGRAEYAASGVVGFALKYAIDWTIAALVFGQTWSPLSYWRLLPGADGRQPHVSNALFLTLFAVSLPFLWFAMAATLLRLRDAGRSAGWGALLFLPFVNLLLFIALSLLPPRRVTTTRDLSGMMESALFAVVSAVAIGSVTIAFATRMLATYGLGLFIAVPFTVGYLSAFLHHRRHPEARIQPFAIAFLSISLLGGFLLALAWEGVLCLVMALPLALVVAMLGAYLGIASARATARHSAARGSFAVVLALPLMLLGEDLVRANAPQYRVDTAIVIDAPIEEVWKNVVSFPDITTEPEWYFRAGIAYPIRAVIHGRGVGATRYCEFSTGSFVEPIEVWDEPRLLRFSVVRNPPPMRELSPYADIQPAHLEGFLVSTRGQFALRRLSAAQTEVVGTTWYQHRLYPAAYWTLWSDAIIHRIHLRVLAHIKSVSEDRV